MSSLRVGIFGGTFNPVHTGHLVLAESARDQLSLDRVIFIPAAHPPHKPVSGLVAGPSRLRMVRLAIRDHAGFAASDIELARTGPSYMLDTVKELRVSLPGARLFLLIGGDMLKVRWMGWAELKRLCAIAVVDRPGVRVPAQRGLTRVQMPGIAISSSDIRERVAAGRSIRYLVPAPVERYIRQHHLYATREDQRR
jgi:nicotinate-nucleotide adenylyltransferase